MSSQTSTRRTTAATPPRTRQAAAPRRFNVGGMALSLLTWVIVLLFFFPVFWMALTGFKKESDAATDPPHFFFKPTLSQYHSAISDAGPFVQHSVIITVVSTALAIGLALPAAYALSIAPVAGWRDALFF